MSFKIIWKYFLKLTSAKTFNEGIKPVLLLMIFSAMTPFKFDLSETPKAFFCPPLVVYTLGLSAIYLTCCVKVLIGNETIMDFFHTSQLLAFSDKIRIIIGILCIFSVSIEALTFINRYAIQMNDNLRVNRAMVNLGIEKDHNKLFRQSWIVVIASQLFNLLFVALIYWITSTWSKKPSWQMMVALFVPEYFTEMIFLIYIYASFLVVRDVELVNKQLATLCDSKLLRGMDLGCVADGKDQPDVRDVNKEIKTRALVKRINMIWKVYDRICDVTDSIYDASAFKMLAMVVVCFVSIVFNLFYVVSVVTSMYTGEYSDVLVSVLYFSLHQTAIHMIFILILTYTCERCKLTTNVTGILINKLLMQEQSEEVGHELHRFSTYMLHRRPVFSVLGMFTIDNTLLFTIIGATTTYLIILIQFSVTL